MTLRGAVVRKGALVALVLASAATIPVAAGGATG